MASSLTGAIRNFVNQNKPQTATSQSTPSLTNEVRSFVNDPQGYTQSRKQQQFNPTDWNDRNVLGKIYDMMNYNPQKAQKLYSDYKYLQTDPTSRYYNPYKTATNKAVSQLASYGIDTSVIDDDFFERNKYLTQYLNYNGQTNTPSAPGKKASAAEKAAYAFYQVWNSEEATKKAEKQWIDLQNDLNYWAQRDDRNMSDDEIIDKIDWSKYSELTSMEKNMLMKPNEYNRAIGYSKDAMYGVLWAARNGGGTGSLEGDIAMSTLGRGTTWKEDERIRSLLNPESSDYLPYATGSTNLDDAAQHFQVKWFTKDWTNTHRYILSSGSEEDIKYYRQVQKAEENTIEAEKALSALNTWIADKCKNFEKPEDAIRAFERLYKTGKFSIRTPDGKREEIDLKILKKMDESMGMNGDVGTTDLLPMTRSVNYKYDNIVKQISDLYEQSASNPTSNGNKMTGYASANWLNRESGDLAAAINSANDSKLNEVGDIISEAGTDAEQDYVSSSWSSSFDDVKSVMGETKATADPKNVVSSEIAAGRKSYFQDGLETLGTVYDYDTMVANRELWKDRVAEIEPLIKDKIPTINTGDRTETITVDGKDYRVSLSYDQDSGYYVKSIQQDVSGNSGTSEYENRLMEAHKDDDRPGRPTYSSRNAQNNIQSNYQEVDDDTYYDLVFGRHSEIENFINNSNQDVANYYLTRPDEYQLTDEERALYDEYRALQANIEDADWYISSKAEDYNKSKDLLNEAQAKKNEEYFMLIEHGIDTVDLQLDDAVMGYLAENCADYEATVWSVYNPSDVYRMALSSGEDREKVYASAAEGNKQIKLELEDAKAVKAYLEANDLPVPDDYMKNLDRHIAKLERDIQDYEYFILTKESDFKELAQKGRDMEYENRPKTGSAAWFTKDQYFNDIDNYVYDEVDPYSAYGIRGLAGVFTAQLSEDEKDIYYYLMAKGDSAKAVEYINSLTNSSYGVLQTRFTEDLNKQTRDAFRTKKSADFKTKEEADQWVAQNGEKYKDYDVTQDENGYHINWTEANGWGFVGENILAVLSSPLASLASLGYGIYSKVSGNEINPYNAMLVFNNFRTTTREQSAKEIALACGEDTLLQKGVQMFYEMVTNRLDSLANSLTFGAPSIGGKFGEALSEFIGASPMGFSAAMDAMMQAKKKGASDGQAWKIGYVTFLAETGTEAISLDNMKKAFKSGETITAEGIKEFLQNWVSHAGPSEAIGESLNDIIENLHDELILGEMSDHADRVWGYRMNGYSKDEAEWLARYDEITGVVRTAVMSYLSPGMDIIAKGAGRLNYYNNLISTRQDKSSKNYGKSISQIISEDQERRQKAEEKHDAWVNNDLANGEGALNLDAPLSPEAAEIQAKINEYNLVEAGEERRQKQDGLSFDWEFLKTASKSNESTKTATIATVLTLEQTDESAEAANAAAVNLRKITPKRVSPIRFVQRLVAGAKADNIDGNSVKQGIIYAALGGEETASYKMIQSPEFQSAAPNVQAKMLSTAAYIDAQNNAAETTINKNIYDNRVAETEKKLSQDKDFFTRSKEAKKNVRKLTGALEEAEKAYEKKLNALATEGRVLRAAREAYEQTHSSEALADLVAAQKEVGQRDTELRDQYIPHAQKAEDDLNAAQEEYERIREEEMNEIRQIAILQVEEQNQARAKQKADAQAAQEAAEKAAAEQKALNEELLKKAKETDNFTRLSAEDFVDQNFPNISEEDRKHAIGLAMAAQRAMSHTFDNAVARREFSKNFAKRFNLNYEEVPGRDINGANARIDPSTRTLLINKNATQWDIMYAVLTHEITHLAEGSNTYTELADMALQIRYGDGVTWGDTLAKIKAGDQTSKIVQDYLRIKKIYDESKATKSNNHSAEQILQEIVADSVGYVISGDDAALQRLAQKPNLARRVIAAIKSFIRKAQGLDGEPLTRAQQVVDKLTAILDANGQTKGNGQYKSMQGQTELQNAQQKNSLSQPIFDDAGEEVATELPGGTIAVDNEKFSINTYDMDERARVRDALLTAKNEDGSLRFTKEQVDKYLDDALDIFVRVEMDPHRLYYEANSHHPFLKANDEYFFTLDASTLCAKRLLYQGTFNAVQHMMPDTAFMPEDLIDLVNIMREMGYETPCGICYVESRRRWLDNYAREWLEGFKGENKPTLDQLTTSDGLEELRRNDKKTYDAFVQAMNKKGSNNPKVVQLRTEYDGDIIKLMSDEDVQNVKDIGGLRIQSFSDFETPHLLDMMQAIMDMASRGLTSQAYTKVPNFAWVFGDTGIKINLSLIGKGTGLDENGKLVFDNVEGMNFDEAMKLRKKYSKNVGTILVGINEAHIIAAMGDSRIDYIIPFHKSGWSQEEIRKVGTLNNYDDFTAFQNERVILGRETVTKQFTQKQKEAGEVEEWIRNRQKDGKTKFNVKEENGVITATAEGYKTQSFDKEAEGKVNTLKEKYKKEGKEYKNTKKNNPDYVETRVNFAPVGAMGYWDFKKSGRENAEAYLEMCKNEGRIPKFWQFLVDNGDGSFSLPQGTDEQSTAIREGYWKTLVDFKMYDNDGNGSEQTAVAPNINMAEAYRVMNSYELGRQMPDRKDGTKGPFIPMESNNDLPTAMPAAEMFVEHMKAKQARRLEQERLEKERIARGEKIKRIPKADRALMEEQENLRLLNERLQAAGYEGNLTLGDEESEGGRSAYTIDPETGEVREGWKAAQKTGESTERFSLPAVEPVMPSNEDWVRDVIQTFPELKAAFPNMYNIQDDRTEEQKKNDTSIAGTVSTYRKIFSKLKDEGFSGTILDASSGMGLGTRAGRDEYSLNVDDIEPFPAPDYQPSEGTDYSKLNKKYDVIISNAVLNVLTQDERDALVTKMGELLNDGGRMFINVRGVGDVSNLRKNLDNEWIEANGQPSPDNPYTGKKNIQIGENEYYTGKGTYQKGFTPQELASYLMDVLGPDYSVTIDNKHETSGSSSSGVVVTKNARSNESAPRYSLPSDYEYLSAVDHGDMDKAQEEVNRSAENSGFSLEDAYHGTESFGFTEFDMGLSQGEIFVAYNPSMSKSYIYDGDVREIGVKTNRKRISDMQVDELEDLANELPIKYQGYDVENTMYYSSEDMTDMFSDEYNHALSMLDGLTWDDADLTYLNLVTRCDTIDEFIDYCVEHVYAPEEAIRACETPKEMLQLYLDCAIEQYLADGYRDDNKNLAVDLMEVFFNTSGEEREKQYSRFMAFFDDLDSRLEEVFNGHGAFRIDLPVNATGFSLAIQPGDFSTKFVSVGDMKNILDRATSQGIYKLYTRPGKQLVVDAQGNNWNDIPFNGFRHTTREIADYAKKHDYDSVRINNVYDFGGRSGSRRSAYGDLGIFFNQEDVKSADTVTYDDDGNIIPPSERFGGNQDMKNDIRYSLPSDDILQRMIQEHLMSNNTRVNNDAYAEGMEGQNPGMSQENGPGQRQFGRGMLQNSDEIDQAVRDYILKRNAYFPDTNADQINRAIKWIRSNKRSADSDGYAESFQAVTSNNFNYMSADGQARMLAVMGMAVAKGNAVDQATLNDMFNRQGTDLGRALQARKLFMLMTPEGRVQSLENMMKRVQGELDAKGIRKNLTFSHWIYDMAAVAEKESDFRQLQRIAAGELANQIPANWKDKLRSFRMLAMLGNPRTHIRNILGNAVFVPVVGIKNKVGALLEMNKPQGQKTKTLALRLDDAVRDYAKMDALKMKDILTGEAKYNENNLIAQQMKAFGGLLQAVMDFNSNKLEQEDWKFLKGHYTRALGGWMQANGYTAEQLNSNSALLEQGRAYAVLEAQKATYRDFNEFAQRLNDFVRKPKSLEGKAGALIVEAVLPFKKTPANILRRGLEYSPVGLIKSFTYDLHNMHRYQEAIQNGYETIPEGAITPNQWLDKIASGLTGTGIMALGALLSSMGLITCGAADDDDPEKMKGGQKYSLKILGTDVTYTLDWAAPACIPFFVGAALMEEHEDMTWTDFANAVTGITEPMYNLTMLDGLSSIFQTSSYGDKTDPITQVGLKVGTNYVSSYWPSLFGAIARTVDGTRRKSYVPADKAQGPAGTINYAWESLKNKIPGASYTSIPMRDVWGEEETSSLAERIFENFISPGYINQTKNDPILNEMCRLHDSHVAGSDKLVPNNPPKSYTYNNEKYIFSDEEYDRYYVTRAQTAHELLSGLLRNQDYRNADDAAKVEMMRAVWEYANKVGLSTVVPNYDYEQLSLESIAEDGKVNSLKSKMISSLESSDWEGYETMVEALYNENIEDSKIRDWIRNKFINTYKAAYKRNDYAEMARVENLLDNSGFTFDTLAWEEAVDEKYGY